MFYYIIDKMYSLSYNYGKWTSKFGQNIFIQEFSYNYCNIGFECLCIYPLSCIICNYYTIFVVSQSSCWFNWTYKIQTPFHERFIQKYCYQLGQTFCFQSSDFLTIVIAFAKFMNIFEQHWPLIFCIQNFLCMNICSKMSSCHSFM